MYSQQRPPEGAAKDLTQAPHLLCSQYSRDPTSLRIQAQVLPTAHHALHDLPLSPPCPSLLPLSLWSLSAPATSESCCSPKIPRPVQPQGLCTCCFPELFIAPCLHPFSSLIRCHCLNEAFPSHPIPFSTCIPCPCSLLPKYDKMNLFLLFVSLSMKAGMFLIWLSALSPARRRGPGTQLAFIKCLLNEQPYGMV